MKVDVQPHPLDAPDPRAVERDGCADREACNRVVEHHDHSKFLREKIHAAQREDGDDAERERAQYEAADDDRLGPYHE
jgi:hypothetical protein